MSNVCFSWFFEMTKTPKLSWKCLKVEKERTQIYKLKVSYYKMSQTNIIKALFSDDLLLDTIKCLFLISY